MINVAGSFLFDNGIVNQVDYFFRDSDYSLTEQHAEVEGGHGVMKATATTRVLQSS